MKDKKKYCNFKCHECSANMTCNPLRGTTFPQRPKELSSDTDKKAPKSKAQKIFVRELTKFQKQQVKFDKELLETTGEDFSKYSPDLTLYYFRDDNSVSVDGTLYDILADGAAEFGFGGDFYSALTKALEKAGYYLERFDSCTYVFAK